MRIISGTARGRKIIAPDGLNTRPTLDRVRENLFNIIQTRIFSARVLDLFAGSGTLSFEAISRGAHHAVLCDHNRNAYRTEKENAEILGFSDRVEFLHCDWKTAVEKMKDQEKKFDIIFLDPPYQLRDLTDLFARIEPLLDENGIIVHEHEARAVITCNCNFEKTDERKWGICGISFYQKPPMKMPDGKGASHV